MTVFRFFGRSRSLNLASSLLVFLLQRAPLLRSMLTAESQLVAPAASVLRSLLLPAAAALGAVHTLAGATTQIVANVALPAKATAGQPFALSVAITGLGVSFAQSWDITATLPPGVVPVGGSLSGSQYIINVSAGTITLSGTPTVAGTYSFTVRGYQYTNRTGPVSTGSTTIVVAAAPNSAPVITRQPAAVTTVVGGSIALTVTYTGSPGPTFHWSKDGTAIAGATDASLTISPAAASDSGNYSVLIKNSVGSAPSAVAAVVVNAAPAAPLIVTAPAPQTVVAGGAAIFTAAVSGVPLPTLQWSKNGAAIAGATNVTLIMDGVKATDAGVYAVTAKNSSGTTTSAGAQLTVTPASVAPAYVTQPTAVTAALGSTVVFSVAATGTPTPTYQWQRNLVDIPGATGAILLLPQTTAADAASYRAITSNNIGPDLPSKAATLSLVNPTTPGRLSNLSILTPLASGESMTLGTVLGGAGTQGTKALLVRAAGPSLTQLGVTAVLPDPKISLIAPSTGAVVDANNDWLGTATLSNAFAQVGAFAYLSASSKDAAILAPALASGSYTVAVSDAATGAGTVIAELYDSTPSASFLGTTPRLINVSVRKQLATGATLTAGFVVGGTTAKTVLVRAIGPGLAAFGIGDAMPDPTLALFSGSTQIAQNDNWGGALPLTTAGNAVGAFTIPLFDSKDAMLVATLAPGNYSAQVTGNGAGGSVLVEVYEVP